MKKLLLILLCLPFLTLAQEKFSKTENNFMTTTIGYHPAVGVENFGMSLSALNLISGFGCYFNTFGVGNMASSSSYSSPFPGDALVSTYQVESLGAMSYGLTYQVNNRINVYFGYSNGEKWILDGSTYYDPLHILDPTGYYDVEYSYTEKNPGIDVGIYYQVTNVGGYTPIMIVGGYNSSMSTVILGGALGISIPTK